MVYRPGTWAIGQGQHLFDANITYITYIATGEGWLYLASVLDLGCRRLLGCSMADHMRTELVSDALTMAAGARGGATAGIISTATAAASTSRMTTASSSPISGCVSPSDAPACAGTTRSRSRSGHR